VDLCKVFVLVIHQKAEVVACVCVSWYEATNDQNFLFRVIIGDKNLDILLQNRKDTVVLSLENPTLHIQRKQGKPGQTS
jgi:hypothetical protein